MIICENCGAELPDGAKFCHNCGNTVADVPVKQDLGEKCAYFKADGLRYAILNGEAVVFNQLGECAETVTVPDVVNYNGKVYDVTAISKDAFKGCKRLSQIVTGNKVTEIGEEAFSGCTILKSITIGEGVKAIGKEAFSGCTILKSITIGKGVKTIGKDAFKDCNSLTRVGYTGDLKNWCGIDGLNFLTTRSDRALFLDGRELEGQIAIPDGVKKIGSGAFRYCNKITDIVIPKSVTSIGDNAFDCCNNLKMICYTGNLAGWCGIEGLYALMKTGRAIYIDGKELSGDLVIPDGAKSIGADAFRGCSGLTSITIPDGVTSISSSAFRDCSALTSITIPDSVTSIGACAFAYCSGLTSIIIPDSVTSIGNDAFYCCNNLKICYTGDLAGWCGIEGLDTLMETWRALYIDGKKLSGDLVIPDGVTSIDYEAFRDCSGLTSVTIPDSVTSIGNCAFEGCSQLKKIYYKGTKEDWAKIGIDTEAIPNKVKIYYYSENKPKLSLTTKYWHFAADGKTPEIW